MLALFLFHFSAIVTTQFYKELFVLVALFREALNEKGYLYKIKYGEEAQPGVEFCSDNDISIAPELANLFVAEIFPEKINLLKKR
jgi:hypothetical protein